MYTVSKGDNRTLIAKYMEPFHQFHQVEKLIITHKLALVK